MHTNHDILSKFYNAFSKANATEMASYYHVDAIFSDPVFDNLNYAEVIAMWEMLVKRSNGNLLINFSNVEISKEKGSLTWTATYEFSQTKRKVINKIKANFEFKDGLILKHTDSFNLWKWSGMALGWKGYLLGWTPFFKQKIREQARKSLANYMKK